MYLRNQIESAFDEASLNSDSSSLSNSYKIQNEHTSYGVVTKDDESDYYQITPGVGAFVLYVTSDASNGFVNSISNSEFSVKIMDSLGNVLLTSEAGDNYTRKISFSSKSTDSYYVEISHQSVSTLLSNNYINTPVGYSYLLAAAQNAYNEVMSHGGSVSSSNIRLAQAQAAYNSVIGNARIEASKAAEADAKNFIYAATIQSTNHAPTGSVLITGITTQGQVLAVSNTLADSDGLGVIAYQWFRGATANDAISGATQSSYTLTADDVGKKISVIVGYVDGLGKQEGVFSNETALVTLPTNYTPTGFVTISGTAQQNQTLTATNTLADSNGLGAINYQWLSNGSVISSQLSYALTQNDVGKNISVTANYTDGLGKLENVTSSSVTVSNVNDAPTGSVSISGTVTQGQTLTASNTLADVDGLGTISYQWLNNGNIISGANQTTYTLTASDVGKALSVKASYTDLQGTAESVTSNETALIALPLNHLPTGSSIVTFPAINEDNGSYSWKDQDYFQGFSDPDGDSLQATNITAKNGTLTKNVAGDWILTPNANFNGTVELTYDVIDNKGGSIPAKMSFVINPINDAPTGLVSISGEVQQGQTLTATNSLTDLDGLGSILYQWLSNGVVVSTQENYTLTTFDVGKTITVKASYTDLQNTAENVTSGTTALVAPPANYPPTGDVTIFGAASQNQTLTVSNTIEDVNGLGSISYQWLSDGVALRGKTQNSYDLTESDVGKNISVAASYTDGLGKRESVTSDSVQIDNMNNDPTGSLTITGKAKAGSTLSVKNTLIDSDGMNDLTFTWLGDGEILGNGKNFLLTNEQKNLPISVVANYIDDYGNAEEVSSDATENVIALNHTNRQNHYQR